MRDFQVVPVVDVLGGRAVHAVGGDRARYRPVRSIIAAGDDPRELAGGFRDALGPSPLYLADLDAIAGRGRDLPLYRDLAAIATSLWVDAGAREADDLPPLLTIDGLRVVAGLETASGPDAIAAMLDLAGPDRLIVSLDLRDGRPITPTPDAWGRVEAAEVASRLVAIGVRRVILLDLARVGRGAGVGTFPLLESIACGHPEVQVIIGGGVASAADLIEARRRGASAALVASALHDGRIDRAALERINAPSRD
ncbi:HisA/HisF-related TIM barrel protein [Paludisphaera sp.]|uniref:HisA/HisF-related TIM barrel protein n=1 Tax=Paludisphaera sp. TaxID=2017432 RepID=UPI00301C383B